MAMAITQSDEWQSWRQAVAQVALEHAPVLLREWFPSGRQEGRVFVVGSLSGDKGRSLKVWLDKGNFKDFGDERIKGGNLVALYAQIRQLKYREANEELAERFHIEKPALKSVSRWAPIVPVPDFAPRDTEGWPLLESPLPGVPAGMWAYLDSDGRVLFYRVRLEIDGEKQFRPITFCRDSRTGVVAWHLMAPPKPWALYGLEYLSALPEAPVLICYSADTELLTPIGWTNIADLQREHQAVAQYDPNTECVQFVEPSAWQAFDNTRPLLHLAAEWSDLLVTPEHRVLWRHQRCRAQITKAENITAPYYLPVAGRYEGCATDTPSTDWIRLIAAFQADGTYGRTNTEPVRFNFKKARKKERLREILSACDVTWQEQIFTSCPEWTLFTLDISASQTLKTLLPDKCFVRAMLNWTFDGRNALLNELGYWDGDFVGLSGVRYFTAEHCNAEIISEMAALTGRGCILRRDDRRNSHNWILNICAKSWRSAQNQPEPIEYSGKVYCCTVPSGFLLTRRNGKTTVAGNCEGEKTCDAARMLLPDWVCVTYGAASASNKTTDWSPLLDRKSRIVIWPDNDRVGAKSASELALILQANKPQLVQPDLNWRPGWDLDDALAENWDTARTLEYLEGHLIRPEEPRPERPEVNIGGSDLETQSQAVWQAVTEYDQGPELVRTDAGLAVVKRELGHASRRLMDVHTIRHWLTLHFRLQKFTKDGDRAPVRPDDILLNNLLCHSASGLPHVSRVTEVPIFAPDGRLIDQPGLDRDSGIYYLPAPGFETIEDTDLALAVATIDDLLADFPFQDDTDKAHAVAFAITPIVRLTIQGPTPLFRFEAPQPRTGKTLLMRVLARVSCSNIKELGPADQNEEWAKRITATMREDPEAVLFDNIETLEFPSVKKLLTDDIWEERVLQTSSTLRAPVLCTFGASINNPEVGVEMAGRSLRCRLDAQKERPELGREFHHKHILEFAQINRPMLYCSFLALAKAAMVPDMNAPCLGMYESFCRRLYAILENAGYPGFLGDRDDEGSMAQEDAALRVFIGQWGEQYAENPKTTSELLWIAENCDVYLGRSEKDKARASSLGRTLHKKRGTTFGAWKLLDPLHSREGTIWRLKNANV